MVPTNMEQEDKGTELKSEDAISMNEDHLKKLSSGRVVYYSKFSLSNIDVVQVELVSELYRIFFHRKHAVHEKWRKTAILSANRYFEERS